jgi:hypothetical protein
MSERENLKNNLFPQSNKAKVEGLDPSDIRSHAAVEKMTSESLRYGAYLRSFIDDTRASDGMTVSAREDGIRAMARLISLNRTELTGQESDQDQQRLTQTTDALTQIVTINTYAPLEAQFMGESAPDPIYDPSAHIAQQILQQAIEKGKAFASEFRDFVKDTEEDNKLAHFKRIRGVNALAQAITLYVEPTVSNEDPERTDKLQRLQQTQELFKDLYIANYIPTSD